MVHKREGDVVFREMECIWGDDVDKALAGKDFVIVTLRDYYYHEYAIDMRQIRELLKEDFVESMLQADQGESEEMTQTSF